MKYQPNPEIKEQHKKNQQENIELHKKNKKIRYQKCQAKEKSCGKVDKFIQQIKQGPYYICAICNRGLYQRSVRFFKYKKYQILTSELYQPLKSFDEKLYICETCHKHLYKNEIPCQAVSNKMVLDPIPDELKDFKKQKKS